MAVKLSKNLTIVEEPKETPLSPLEILEKLSKLDAVIKIAQEEADKLKDQLKVYMVLNNKLDTKLATVSIVQKSIYKALEIEKVPDMFTLIEKKLNTEKIKAYQKLNGELPPEVQENVSEYLTIRWKK